MFSIRQFQDQNTALSEMRRRIFKRLLKEGISIPFPTRTLIVDHSKMQNTQQTPAAELLNALNDAPPGRALDLACGSGRHARWLVARGWNVTAVDIAMPEIPGARCIQADLERHEYRVEPEEWDVIVCWLYWQPDLMPEIARGLRSCGIAALAGKTTGRFATSLDLYREAFDGFFELASGSDAHKCFFVAMRLEEAID